MKKAKLKAFKAVKYLIFLFLGFFLLEFFIFGVSMQNKESRKYLVHWTGIDSYFSDNTEKVEWIFDDYPSYEPEGIDGPHIFYTPNGVKALQVNAKNKLSEENIRISDSLLCMVGNEEQDQFYFRLQDEFLSTPDTASASHIMAVSDIEGNFNAFSGLLQANKVIDGRFRWTFGNGHLVLLGDFVDRGEQVTQCLWLIYKLEQEAAKQGGRVHYLLGNHEAMNLQGNAGYVAPKYLGLAQILSGKKSTK